MTPLDWMIMLVDAYWSFRAMCMDLAGPVILVSLASLVTSIMTGHFTPKDK